MFNDLLNINPNHKQGDYIFGFNEGSKYFSFAIGLLNWYKPFLYLHIRPYVLYTHNMRIKKYRLKYFKEITNA